MYVLNGLPQTNAAKYTRASRPAKKNIQHCILHKVYDIIPKEYLF